MKARRREELDTVEGIGNRVDELGREVFDLREQVVPLLERIAAAAERFALATEAQSKMAAELLAGERQPDKKGPPPEAS
jgi:hypothetical protein